MVIFYLPAFEIYLFKQMTKAVTSVYVIIKGLRHTVQVITQTLEDIQYKQNLSDSVK